MFDTILDNLKRLLKSRLFPIAIIYLSLFMILIYRLFDLQIVQGPLYEAKGEAQYIRTRYIDSTRGNIYDKYGKLLAYNDLSYAVTLLDVGAYKSGENDIYNAMLYQLITILEENGATIDCEFYLELDENNTVQFNVEESAQLRFKKDIYSLPSVDKLLPEQVNASAEDIFQFLAYGTGKKSGLFGISKDYTKEEALEIMKVRYAMFMNQYSRHNAITVSHNVNEVVVAAIKESSAKLPGVDIAIESYRVYNDSEAFAQILGYTGRVSTEVIQELKANGQAGKYTETDQEGKSGLEKSFEEYLHGTNGHEEVAINEDRRVVDIVKRVEPVAGNDLYLTIDSKLQKACYKILEKKITGILLSKIVNSKNDGKDGNTTSDIRIPIYDVYFSFIKNGVLDINHFNDEEATKTEKTVYQKFLVKQKEVLLQLDKVLAVDSQITNTDLSEEMAEYLSYIYLILSEKEILLIDDIPKDDTKYLAYKNSSISLSEFLQYALSNNWIDLRKLEVGDEYYSTKELYEKLIKDTKILLEKDSTFTKKLYNFLVYSDKLTGTEICLLLFDQGVLQYDERQVADLKKGTISAYNFLLEKIKKLEITPAQLALNPGTGSVVITDVNTGEVLALVSYPGYDNNRLANKMDVNYFSYLTTKEREDNASYLINRPVQQKLAPGSTYKMAVAAAALEEKVIRPTQTIQDEFEFTKIKPSPKCHAHHGSEDIVKAIRDSCNYFFYEIGWRLELDASNKRKESTGLKKLKKYAKMFGFDSPSGIELVEYEPSISTQDAVRSSIGQSNNAYAPAQLSRYVTAIANRGTCYDLTIIDKVKDLNGKVILENKPKVYNKIKLQENTWNLIQEGMYLVLNSKLNSISSLYEKVTNVKIAGKTGTAQESEEKPDHALFVSYAPYQEPEISVTAVIPNGYTSANAAELARDIYMYYFKTENRKKLLEKEVTKPELSSGFAD